MSHTRIRLLNSYLLALASCRFNGIKVTPRHMSPPATAASRAELSADGCDAATCLMRVRSDRAGCTCRRSGCGSRGRWRSGHRRLLQEADSPSLHTAAAGLAWQRNAGNRRCWQTSTTPTMAHDAGRQAPRLPRQTCIISAMTHKHVLRAAHPVKHDTLSISQ